MKNLILYVCNFQFLPQDRVCEFAKLSPVRLLEEIETVVGDPQLPVLYHALVDTSAELQRSEQAVEKYRETLSQQKALNAELERDVERVRQQDELLTKAEAMKKKLPWLKYDMKKGEYLQAKEQEKDAKKKLDEAAKLLNDISEPNYGLTFLLFVCGKMQVPNGWFIRKISKIYWKVRNEAADDFLSLIKEWQNLCNQFGLLGSPRNEDTSTKSEECDIEENEDNRDLSDGEFEVGKLVAICYGQPNNDGISKLHFKLVPRSYVCGLRSSSYIDCVAFDPLALRLLQRMLAFDPKERPTAKRL